MIIDSNKFKLLNVFSNLTNALALDVLELNNKIIFLIKDGDYSKYIKNNKDVLKSLSHYFKKKVLVYELSEDSKLAVSKFFKPFKVEIINYKIDKKGKLLIQVIMNEKDKNRFLSRPENLKLVKELIKNKEGKEVKILIKSKKRDMSNK